MNDAATERAHGTNDVGIRAEGLTKRYGDVVAVDAVDLALSLIHI